MSIMMMNDMGSIELLHSIPGRVRLRVPAVKRNPALALQIHQQLSACKTVRGAEISPVTGSVLVHFDRTETEALPEIRRTVFTGLDLADGNSVCTKISTEIDLSTSLAESVVGFFRELNASLRAATGGLDLRILLPAAFLLLGVKGLLVGRKSWPTWYNYLWFAFGMFLTLNRSMAALGPAPAAEVAEATSATNGQPGSC